MEFTIRPIEVSDARGINMLRRMPGVFENILGIPSERVKRNEDFLMNLDNNHHEMVAIAKDENGEDLLIGTAGLMVSAPMRMRHSASIGIMVHKDYQNMGVGSALMESLIDIADNWLMLVRLELTVFEDNERAIHLYEKLGFEKEGLRLLSSIRNGKYENDYLMARIHSSYK